MPQLISIAILAGLVLWGIGLDRLDRVVSKAKYRQKGQLGLSCRRSTGLSTPFELVTRNTMRTELQTPGNQQSS